MKLRYKKTGEILDVPDAFAQSNPDLYESPTQQPSQPQTQDVQQAQPKDIISQGQDILNSLLSPFKETGKRIGGAAFEAGRAENVNKFASVSNQLSKQLDEVTQKLKTEKDPIKKKALLEQSRSLGSQLGNVTQAAVPEVTAQNPLLSTQEMQDISTNPRKELIKQAGRGAQIVSWGVPGAGFKSGALVGGLQNIGQQLEQNQNIDPTQALLSAGLGGVTSAALNKILGIGKNATKLGEKTQTGVINPQAQTSPFMAEEEQRLTKVATDELGLKTGSGQKMLEQLPEKFRQVQNDISNIVKGSDKTFTKKQIQELFDKALEGTDYIAGDKAWEKAKKEVFKKISSQTEEMSAETINNLKEEIGDTLTKAFQREAKGGVLSQKEQVSRALFDATKEALDTVSPEIRQKNLLQKDIFTLAEGFNKKRNEKIILPVIGQLQGIPGVRSGVQAATAKAGQGLTTGGNILDQILNVGGAKGLTAKSQAAVRGVEGIKSAYTQPQPTTQYTPSDLMNTALGGTTTEQPQNEAQQRLQKAMILDLAQTGGKHIAELKTISEVMNPKPAAESQLTAKDRGNVKSAKASLQEAKTIIKNDPSILAKKLIPFQPISRSYDAASYNAADVILRLRTGAQANESEIRGLQRTMFPWIGDSKQDIDFKLRQLDNILNSYSE